jgi:cytochrome c oxidase cbb3-type subunit 3
MSPLRRTRARRCAVAALAALPLVGCRPSKPDTGALAATPTVTGRAVGPVPGPNRPVAVLTSPFAGDPAAPAEGRRLFVWMNCYGCHGGNAGGGMGPSLRDVDWIYGGSDQEIFNSIAEGRAHGMPAWGTKLPADQIWKLVAYIQCLGLDCEPTPPPRNPSYPDAPTRRTEQAVLDGGAGKNGG